MTVLVARLQRLLRAALASEDLVTLKRAVSVYLFAAAIVIGAFFALGLAVRVFVCVSRLGGC